MGRLKNQLLARVFTAFPSLAARWGKSLVQHTGEVPWVEPLLPLAKARIALVTTGGVHLASQTPFDMSDSEGDASLREVPIDTPREELRITHDYYDHRDAENDLNLVFPVQRLKELVQAGAIGSLHQVGFSIMGHIDGPHLATLQDKTAPLIAKKMAAAGVNYVLLVPA